MFLSFRFLLFSLIFSFEKLMLQESRLLVKCDTNAAPSARNVWHYDLGVARITNDLKQRIDVKERTNDDIDNLVGNDGNNSTSKDETKRKREEGQKVVDSKVGDKKCDFGGRRLKIAASPQPPLVNCFQDFYGEWTCNGSNVEVIHLLSKQMNFELEWLVLANRNLEQPKLSNNINNVVSGNFKKRFSYKHSFNKDEEERASFNYSGVIGLVSSGRAFMAANGVMNTVDRQKSGLLLSEPFDSFKLHFLLSKSVRDHDHIFIKPFSSTAWLGILLSSIFITLAFYIINSTSFHYVLLEDKFLSKQVPLIKTLYYYVTRIIFRRKRVKRKRKRMKNTKNIIDVFSVSKQKMNFFSSLICFSNNNDRRSSNDTTTSQSIVSFDREVDRMISSNGMLNFDTKLASLRIEERRRHKELCRRWFYERKRARRLSKSNHKTGFFKLPYIIWYVASSLANQGGETEDLPHASSTRILIAFWWLYLIVICSIHSGILTAILTFPKQLDFIQTLDDYLNLDESEKMALKLTVDKNSEIANLLSNPDNLHKSPLQQLLVASYNDYQYLEDYWEDNNYDEYKFKQPIVEVDFQRHRQRLLDDVHSGQAAYLEEKSTINLIITQEYFDHKPPKCQFKSSRYPVDIIPMSLVLNKNELLMNENCLNMINTILTRILRMGLAQKWRRKYEALGNDCLNTVIINAGDVSKIEVRHVVLAFWLLASGLLLGVLSLIIEVVWLFTIDIDDDDDDDDNRDNYKYNKNSYRKNSTKSSKSSSSSGVFSSRSSSDYDDDSDSIGSELKLGHKVTTLKSRAPIRSLRDGGKILSFKRALKGSDKKRKNLFQLKKVTPLPPQSLLFLQQPRSLSFISEFNDEDSQSNNFISQDETFKKSTNDEPLATIDLLLDNDISVKQEGLDQIEELSKAIKLDKKRKKAAKLSEKKSRRLKRTLGMVKRINEGSKSSGSKLSLSAPLIGFLKRLRSSRISTEYVRGFMSNVS